MDSFASELGTAFPIRMEAPHIIDPSQACRPATPAAAADPARCWRASSRAISGATS